MHYVQAVLMRSTGCCGCQLVLLLHWQTAVAMLHVDLCVRGQAWAVLSCVCFIVWVVCLDVLQSVCAVSFPARLRIFAKELVKVPDLFNAVHPCMSLSSTHNPQTMCRKV